MKLSKLMIEILQVLQSEKQKDNPFVYMQDYRRGTLQKLADAGLIFGSKGDSKDLKRYTITSAGETALKQLNEPKAPRYWFNGNGYHSLDEMAEAENMSIWQARYRIRNGYQSNAELKHGGAVTIAGKTYPNVKTAAEMLGYRPKSLRRLLSRLRKGGEYKANTDSSMQSKKSKLKKAFERILSK